MIRRDRFHTWSCECDRFFTGDISRCVRSRKEPEQHYLLSVLPAPLPGPVRQSSPSSQGFVEVGCRPVTGARARLAETIRVPAFSILEQFGAEFRIDTGQQEQAYDRGFVNVRLEQVVLFKARQQLTFALFHIRFRMSR